MQAGRKQSVGSKMEHVPPESMCHCQCGHGRAREHLTPPGRNLHAQAARRSALQLLPVHSSIASQLPPAAASSPPSAAGCGSSSIKMPGAAAALRDAEVSTPAAGWRAQGRRGTRQGPGGATRCTRAIHSGSQCPALIALGTVPGLPTLRQPVPRCAPGSGRSWSNRSPSRRACPRLPMLAPAPLAPAAGMPASSDSGAVGLQGTTAQARLSGWQGGAWCQAADGGRSRGMLRGSGVGSISRTSLPPSCSRLRSGSSASELSLPPARSPLSAGSKSMSGGAPGCWTVRDSCCWSAGKSGSQC